MVVEWERARDQSLLDAITFEKMLHDYLLSQVLKWRYKKIFGQKKFFFVKLNLHH